MCATMLGKWRPRGGRAVPEGVHVDFPLREETERQIPASGCTYFVCRLMFGGMSEDQAAASIDLFAADVMPYLAKLAPR